MSRVTVRHDGCGYADMSINLIFGLKSMVPSWEIKDMTPRERVTVLDTVCLRGGKMKNRVICAKTNIAGTIL